jgi:anti-sigma factor RsiW
MADGHERFEALALSHVLGGLGSAEAADLRDHLRGCVACRARVAELREMSDELDAAARDERRRSAAARRRLPEAPEAADATAPVVARRWGRLVVTALAIACLPIAFWNLHLRSASDAYFATAQERAATIEVLATGRTVEVAGPVGGRGRIAVDGARVAIVLVGAGPLGSDERIVAWLGRTDDDGGATVWTREVLAVGPIEELSVSALVARDGADRLVVSLERGLLGAEPAGAAVVELELTGR